MFVPVNQRTRVFGATACSTSLSTTSSQQVELWPASLASHWEDYSHGLKRNSIGIGNYDLPDCLHRGNAQPEHPGGV